MSLQLIVKGRTEESPVSLMLRRVNSGLTSRANPQKGDVIVVAGIGLEIDEVKHFYEPTQSGVAPSTHLISNIKNVVIYDEELEKLLRAGFEHI